MYGISSIIQKEIERAGFIEDSDLVDRFVDRVTYDIATEVVMGDTGIDYEDKDGEIELLRDKLINYANEFLANNYNSIGEINERGDYKGYYYTREEEYDSIEDLESDLGIGE